MASLVFASIEDLMPENPDALHLLGVIAHQVGKNELAVKLITKAVAANLLVDAPSLGSGMRGSSTPLARAVNHWMHQSEQNRWGSPLTSVSRPASS